MADTAKAPEIDATLVTVGKPVEGGCAFTCFADNPTLPTSASEALAEGFESLGDLSENGFTQTTESTSNDFKGWHGKVLLTDVTDEKDKVKLELVEVGRLAAAQLRFGAANVKASAEDPNTFEAIDARGIPAATVPLVIDELESNGWLRRTVYPKVKVDSVDDVAHQRGSLMVYGMSFTAVAGADGSTHHVYHARPKPAAGPGGGDAPAGPTE